MKVSNEYKLEQEKRRVFFDLPLGDDLDAFDFVLIAISKDEKNRVETIDLPNINQRGEMFGFYISPPTQSDFIDKGTVGSAWTSANIEKLAKSTGQNVKQIEADLLGQFRRLRREKAKRISAEIEKILITQSNEAQVPIIQKLTGYDSYRQDYVTTLKSKEHSMVKVKKGKVTVKPRYLPAGKKATYDLSNLSAQYQILKKLWDKAAKAASQNSAEKFSETFRDLPEDLIQRLWPLSKEARRIPETKGHHFTEQGLSRLSEIALEHAARLCGVGSYELSVSRLRTKERETRK